MMSRRKGREGRKEEEWMREREKEEDEGNIKRSLLKKKLTFDVQILFENTPYRYFINNT